MKMRMKRTQILFPDEQYRRLRQEAVERHCSVGALVREAVDKEYLRSRKTRQEAALKLVAMSVPVSDWDEMEAEIERGMRDA